MTNLEIVESYYNLHILKMDKEYYEEKLAYYQKGLDDINKFISAGERVWEIYDGIPIGQFETSASSSDYFRFDINKRAHVYESYKGGYGINFKLNSEDKSLFNKTLKEAKDLIIKYLISNSSPAEFLYDYERGKL